MKILISGGAGFVGSTLGILFKEKFSQSRVVALDNLKRRGSELNLPRLKASGIEFKHGDIREPTDLFDLQENFDLFIEASAEPSVLSGMQGDSPHYALHTNLTGTMNCLEFARARCGKFLFLSTSRVYSVPGLINLSLKKGKSRLELSSENPVSGLSAKGIGEAFSTAGYRSIYGTTKLASEMLIEEYVHAYQLKALINRCSILCGPWQMGKVDQGAFTLWMARHVYGGKLQYTGYEGTGFQVRDLLHPRDLFSLIIKQLDFDRHWNGSFYNVGGGMERSLSLFEHTGLCREISGRNMEITPVAKTSSVDIPFYVSDTTRVEKTFNWAAQTSVREIMTEVHQWFVAHEKDLKPIFT